MGAGLIGLEVGVGLMERGLSVTIVEMLLKYYHSYSMQICKVGSNI